MVKVIFEIVDWGSKQPISENLYITDNDFNNMINFIDIKPDISNKYDNFSIGKFFVEAACNVGFRRSQAEYILQCPADQLLSKNSLSNLYNFLSLKNKRKS